MIFFFTPENQWLSLLPSLPSFPAGMIAGVKQKNIHLTHAAAKAGNKEEDEEQDDRQRQRRRDLGKVARGELDWVQLSMGKL